MHDLHFQPLPFVIGGRSPIDAPENDIEVIVPCTLSEFRKDFHDPAQFRVVSQELNVSPCCWDMGHIGIRETLAGYLVEKPHQVMPPSSLRETVAIRELTCCFKMMVADDCLHHPLKT